MSTTTVSVTSLNTLINQLGTIQSNQHELSAQVGGLAAGQEVTRSEVANVRAMLEDYIRNDQLQKAMQFAQTKLIDVRAQLQTEFGHYGEVRRFATGLLQAADAGVVSNGTMRGLSEELMLTSPRYWLAPAVVGLAAWMRDDQPLARRALAEALRRDPDKTALFFALILRRHRRNGATATWLHHYVGRQEPTDLGREFVVVLDAVATGAFGHEARPLVMSQVAEWFEAVNADTTIREAQVSRWMDVIDGLRAPVPDRFTVLPHVSPTWPALKSMYEGATVQGAALARLSELFAGEVVVSHDQRRRVDDILNSLVTNFDTEELPARREETELKLVIEHRGDEVAARQALDAVSDAQEERVDILTLLSNAAFAPETAGVTKGTQRMATAMAAPWIDEAAGRLHAQNTASIPRQVELTIEGWRGTVDQQSTEQGLADHLVRSIDQDTATRVAAVKFGGGPMAAAVIGGILVFIGLIVAIASSAGGGIFLLLLGLGAGGWAWTQYAQIPKRRAALQADGERRKAQGLSTLRGAIAEIYDVRQEWHTEQARSADLHAYVTGLSAHAHTVSASDEQRLMA